MKTKKIKDIKVGDYVKSYDHKNDKMTSRRVTQIFKHENVPGTKIILNKQFVATGNHPVYLNGKYKPVSQARVGDIIIDPDGMDIKIHTLEIKPMDIDVYNIEVEGEHNYFAGGILNHNKCGNYKGDDSVVERSLNSLKAKATSFWDDVKGETQDYFRVKEETIGVPTGDWKDQSNWTSLQDPSMQDLSGTTDIDESIFSYVGEQGTAETINIPGWQTTYGGFKTDWGAKVDDFFSANNDYQDALQVATNATIAAEDALATAQEDVELDVESEGASIALEAKSAREEIETATATMGFAASGAETEMKQDVRSGAGEAWSKSTGEAQVKLQNSLDEYAKLMGGESDNAGNIDLTGEGNLGSIQTNLNSAYDSFIEAKDKLQADISEIQSSLADGAATYRSRVRGYKNNWEAAYTTINTALAGEGATHYAPSMQSVTNDIEAAIGAFTGYSGEGAFEYEALEDMNRPASFGAEYGGATTGGGDNPSALAQATGNFLGLGECLEGNVKVVMGEKNASK